MALPIINAQHVWDRVRTLFGLRQSTIEQWIKDYEVLEIISDLQLDMATQLPEALAGELRVAHEFSAGLDASGYANVRKFTLPEDPFCLQVVFVNVNLDGTGYKQCDLQHSDDTRKLASTNPFDMPTEDYPWALRLGKEVWIAPVAASVSTIPVMLDMIKAPVALADLADNLQVMPQLRSIMPNYVASVLFKKKRVTDRSAEEYGMFTTKWLQITGSEWVEVREGHTPPATQKTAEGTS